MRSLILATGIVVMLAGPAEATMPKLTPLPAVVTLQSCQQWAKDQDEDARYMWGQLESGKVSEDVAQLRLALSCLGDTPPPIVGFGSSAGAAREFCKTHRRAPICARGGN
jgi:hypothetical protein